MDHVPYLECAAVVLDGGEVLATRVRMIVIITTTCLYGEQSVMSTYCKFYKIL